MTQANDERAARKEYIRRRQKTVFSIVGAVMVVAMVVSLLFFFHVGGLGNVKSAAIQPNYGQQAPCPIKEADGNKAKYVENRNITLRVSVITSGAQPMLKLRWVGEEVQREEIAQEFKAVLQEKIGTSAALSLGAFDPK